MPKPHPREFRDDVVAVARRGEASIAQVAKDFGISDSCLRNWLHAADVQDGNRPGATVSVSVEVRELRRRNRLLKQEVEVLRATYTLSWTDPAISRPSSSRGRGAISRAG